MSQPDSATPSDAALSERPSPVAVAKWRRGVVRLSRVIAVLALCSAIVTVLVFLSGRSRDRRLAEDGRFLTGVVERFVAHKRRTGKEATDRVTFSFVVDGVRHRSDFGVGRSSYIPGQRVTVRYVAGDPKTATIVGADEDRSALRIFGIWTLTLVGALLALEPRRRRTVAALRDEHWRPYEYTWTPAPGGRGRLKLVSANEPPRRWTIEVGRGPWSLGLKRHLAPAVWVTGDGPYVAWALADTDAIAVGRVVATDDVAVGGPEPATAG